MASRKPLWLDLQPVDIKSRWRHNWKSAQVVNSHLVCDPTIRQPGLNLPRQQWSLLNSFRTEQGHCGVCRRKWRLTDTDLCPCGETQTMSHVVESCPLTKLNGGLSRLHSADKHAVSWLTSYCITSGIREKEDSIWVSGPEAILTSRQLVHQWPSHEPSGRLPLLGTRPSRKVSLPSGQKQLILLGE